MNYLRQEEVRPRDAVSEGRTSLAACSSESEVRMLLVGIARTDADIPSTSLHQRHGGSGGAQHFARRSRTKLWNRSVSAAGPSSWNSPPDDIETSPSLVVFKTD